MKRPLIFAVTAAMALTLSACSVEEESADDNDQEVPAETDEGTDDDSENGEESVEETEEGVEENGENGSEGTSDDDSGTENGTEDEGTEENGTEEADEDGTATEEVDLLFFDEEALNTYRESRTVTADSEEELPAAALEEWLNGPESDELTAILADEGVQIQYVEDQNGTAHVSFSPEVTNANFGSSAEVGFLDQVAHIMAQFGYDSTQFLLDGEVEESLFGHADTSEPYTPDDGLENYDEID